MAVNKVIYDGATLVDLTGDTVTADNLAAGVKATGADGKPIVGLLPKVTIDSQLSDSSTNPVQNKVIKAAIPTKVSALRNDAGYLTQHQSLAAYVKNSELKAVAKTGSYNDLTNKPTIPAAVIVDDTLDANSTNAVQNKVVYGLGQKFFNQLSALASVARTGSYSDLTGTPGNATTSAAGLMSAADKAKLDKVDADVGGVKLIIYS